jgi:cytochrome c-type biogenesis protein CcsB
MLFNYTTLCYFIAMVAFIVFVVSKGRIIGIVGSAIAYLGFFIQTAAIGLRWKESYDLGHGHAPLSNLYESIVFFSWTIVLILGLLEIKYKHRVIGAFVLPFAFLAMAWAQLGTLAHMTGSGQIGKLAMPTAIEPLLPALQSNWLLYHVVTCFLGYAAFAVMYLIKVHHESAVGNVSAGSIVAHFPSVKILDDLNYKAIMVGFPLLTLGIITGAAWANYAWGSYWSWDPKETWSLIVWFIYAAFLHARITRGWVGKRAAVLSIFGFIATIFCYLGVNLLLSGLHSYGGG